MAAVAAIKIGKKLADKFGLSKKLMDKLNSTKTGQKLLQKIKGYKPQALGREDGVDTAKVVLQNRVKTAKKALIGGAGAGAGAVGVSSTINRSREAKNKKILDAAREKVSFVGDGKPKKFSGKLMQDKKKTEDKKKTTTKAKAPKKVTPKFKYESSSQTKDDKKKKKKYDSLPKGMSARLAYGGGMMKKKMAYGGKVKKMMGGGRVKKRYV